MYDSDQGTVIDSLRGANPTVFSDDTISKILALSTRDNTTVRFDTVSPDPFGQVTVASGAEVLLVSSSNTNSSNLIVPGNAPVVIFQGQGGVIVDLQGSSTVAAGANGVTDRVVVGTSGADHITLDQRNTLVVAGGNDTIVSTTGNDTVDVRLGNATVVGGSGFESVLLGGVASNYVVTSQNGHAVVTDSLTNRVTDISQIQYVQLDGGKAIIFAMDAAEVAVATIYHTVFGRDADAGGLDFWFDRAREGVDLTLIANGFLTSNEYLPLAGRTDAQFIDSLYLNTFGRTGETAGVNFWVDALSHGATRADVVEAFANLAGSLVADGQHAQVVGAITIIPGIV